MPCSTNAALSCGIRRGRRRRRPDGCRLRRSPAHAQGKAFANAKKSPFSTDEKLTPYKDVTTYNNFYEFGTGKDDPARKRRHAQDRGRGR